MSNKSFFSEIISSISDVKFSQDGRYICSRDYLTLKVWDTHMETEPVTTINIHEHLRAHLCDLYESDCIFDKFEVAVSGDGKYMATGSYNNSFHVYDRDGMTDCSTEVSRNLTKRRLGGTCNKQPTMKHHQMRRTADGVGEVISFDKKILHLAWQPTRDVLAVAGLNRLYFYTV